MRRILNREAKAGRLEKKRYPNGNVTYRLIDRSVGAIFYKESNSDKRCLPRIGKQYIDLETMAQEAIGKAGKTFTADEIHDSIMGNVAKMKRASPP